MTCSELHIPISSISKQINLKVSVEGAKSFNFRLKIGCLLIKLAALIMQVNCKIETEK